MVSGYSAALAVIAALWQRGASRVGCAIDLAQLEVLATMIAPWLAAVLGGGAVADTLGSDGPEVAAAPHGVYRCRDASGRDRWCAIAIFGDVEWQRFTAAIGSPEWARDARFATAAARRANGAALDQLIESWTRAGSAEAAMQTLQAAGVAAGLAADASDLASDPQLAARGYWVEGADRAQLDGVVPRLCGTPGAIVASAPRLGQHTDEVLRDLLAMEQSALDRLRRTGVIR